MSFSSCHWAALDRTRYTPASFDGRSRDLGTVDRFQDRTPPSLRSYRTSQKYPHCRSGQTRAISDHWLISLKIQCNTVFFFLSLRIVAYDTRGLWLKSVIQQLLDKLEVTLDLNEAIQPITQTNITHVIEKLDQFSTRLMFQILLYEGVQLVLLALPRFRLAKIQSKSCEKGNIKV